MFDATSFSTKRPPLMRRLLAVLLRRPRPPLPLHPLMALLHQVPRQRTVHQLVELRSLAASWLAPPQLLLLDQHLQERLRLMSLEMASRSSSPTSTSSRTKTGRRTTKRRR